MTTSSSVLLTGRESPRESPRDDRGRDENEAGIASLSSLNPHVAIYKVFHFDFVATTVGFGDANFAVTAGVHAYEASVGQIQGFGAVVEGVKGSSWGSGRERETKSSKQAERW